jgi:molecular chaperone DnaJ
MPKNYYILLGLSPGASLEEVKTAYRRRAKELHPDYSGQSSEPFQELQEAYSILGNPSRKQEYDHLLEEIRASHRSRPTPGIEPLAAPGARPEPMRPLSSRPVDWAEASLTRSFWTYRPSLDELFDRLWSNFSQLSRPKDETLQSLTVEIELSPGEASRGGQVRLLVPARAVCPSCGGTGGIGFYECWHCAGEGALSGEYPLMIHFPPGVRDGHQVNLPLSAFGIRNFYLVLRFRVGKERE